jgi:polysaccharide pyruvyl transferase WcaK-like protein
MSSSDAWTKIGVFSHGGTKNLGDEALLAAVIQNVRIRVPSAKIVGFTINPADTHKRHGISCFPIRRISSSAMSGSPESLRAPAASAPASSIPLNPLHKSLRERLKSIPGLRVTVLAFQRLAALLVSIFAEPRFLFQSYRRLHGCDLLLIAGSQQLNDGYGGPWGFPYTLLKWTILCRWTGTKVAILSVGAGPIDSWLSKFFIRRVLNRVNYRSYRDAISSQLVQSIGVKGIHPVFPDLVYSLQLPAPRPAPPAGVRVVVGTNPVPFFDGRYWPTPDPSRYRDYVSKFAKFAEWLDKNGRSVLFFPTQVRADALTIADIHGALNGSGNSPNILVGREIDTIEDLVSEISRADLVIANRYHGILISLMMNKPVLGVAYHEKSRALLSQAGQDDYVLDIADFKTEDLIERVKSMEANAPAIKNQIAACIAPLRKALDEQYDTVLGLIGIGPAAARAD